MDDQNTQNNQNEQDDGSVVGPEKGATAGNHEAVESPSAGDIPQEAVNIAMLAHLLGIITGLIGPLILYLIGKDRTEEGTEFVVANTKAALNFQITLTIAIICSIPLALICIGYFLMLAIVVLDLIFGILACMAASERRIYKYPLSISFVK